jgi:RNA polymerase sigma-70 factor (ECF subfamily)
LSQAEHGFPESNEELLAQCKRGDQSALEVLFRRHERPVYSLLYRMIGNHDDTEEALADVFVKVWRSAGSFRGDARFTTWLYHIAANTAKDRLRSRRGSLEMSFEDMTRDEEAFAATASAEEDPERAVLRAENSAKLSAAIRALSEEDRLLITLHHMQELSCDEMAEITGISVNNLKVKLFRARRKLREACSDMENGWQENELRANTTEAAGFEPRPTECL